MPTDDSGAETAARQEHWDRRYTGAAVDELSWFQAEPSPSLAALAALGAGPGRSLIDVGGGASALVDRLLAAGWDDVTVLDVSPAVLALARERVGDDAGRVTWVAADVLAWTPVRAYDIWHDRAVFHFMVGEDQRTAYRRALAAAVPVGGHAVVATFAPDGPTMCSGLPVQRYTPEELAAALGPGWDLVSADREEHLTPAGAVQPFTWVTLRRAPS